MHKTACHWYTDGVEVSVRLVSVSQIIYLHRTSYVTEEQSKIAIIKVNLSHTTQAYIGDRVYGKHQQRMKILL
jgi:hypothetical protein